MQVHWGRVKSLSDLIAIVMNFEVKQSGHR
jgi:hypothetical protein